MNNKDETKRKKLVRKLNSKLLSWIHTNSDKTQQLLQHLEKFIKGCDLAHLADILALTHLHPSLKLGKQHRFPFLLSEVSDFLRSVQTTETQITFAV